MNGVDHAAPAAAHLDDALELAEILRPTWPAISEENRKTARLLNEGEEPGGEGGDQPSPEAIDSPENNGGGEGSQQESSFLDDYDLGEVSDEARPAVEAYVKRLSAGYTRQRQQDAQVVRSAQDAQLIVDALMDPERRGPVAEMLGLDLSPQEEEDLEEEFDFRDPRVDALLAQQQQDREVSAAEERVKAENAYVTEQIEGLEGRLQRDLADPKFEFSDEELEALYLFADEHRNEQGAPDVEAAFRLLEALGGSYHQRASKPRPRPPRRVGGGGAGEQTVDLSDEEKRQEVMARAGAIARASSE